MTKSLIVLSFLLGLGYYAQAQVKTVVGIVPFTYVQGAANYHDVNSIQEAVTNAFVDTRRFTIVDRTKMEALLGELERQKGAVFIDSKIIKQGVQFGASYLIIGHIISAQAEEMRSDDGKGHVIVNYKARLAISLQIIDVATGEVISSETIEPKAGVSAYIINIGYSSPQAAITKAIDDIEKEVDKFVGRNFPQTFSIAEIQEKDSKGSAKTILIAGGSAAGLKKGDKLKAVEFVDLEVDGKKMTRKKEVCEMKITKVEDENFSICTVVSGGVDLNAKFEAKVKLQLITIN